MRSPGHADPPPRPNPWVLALAAGVFALPLLYLATDRAPYPSLWRWDARLVLGMAAYGVAYAALLASFFARLPRWLATARGLVVMVAATLLANALLLEGVLRILDDARFTPLPDIGRHLPDPELGHVFRPSHRQILQTREWRTEWRSNAQGLRADRDVGPPEPGTRRILAVGDSYTAGDQVPLRATWPGALERAWRAARDGGAEPEVEVWNAGVPAYGTFHEARWIARFAGALEPDGIVLAATPNDLGENRSPDWVTARWGALVNRRTREGDFRRWQHRHRWYSLPGHVERSLLVQRIQRALRGRGANARVHAHRHAFLRDLDAEAEASFRLLEQHLLEARDAAHALGADFAVIVIPYLEQLAPMPDGLDPAAFGRRVTSFAEAHGIPALDLLPAFRAHPDPASLYWREDSHCTAAGYALVGERTAAFLRERGWPRQAGRRPARSEPQASEDRKG